MDFEKGKLKSQSQASTKTDERNGTLVEFTPDEALFGKDFKFRTEFIEDMLWKYAFLNRGLTLTLNGKPFRSQNGLKDLLAKEPQRRTALPDHSPRRRRHRNRRSRTAIITARNTGPS